MANITPYKKLYPKTSIRGFEDVINNLEKEVKKIEDVTSAGMIKAMAHIRAETINTTPVDTGNMRASWFVVTNDGVAEGRNPKWKGTRSKSPSKKARAMRVKTEHPQVVGEMLGEAKSDMSGITVIAGYSANYALYVHEMEGRGKKTINWTNPMAEGKWLEKAFKQNSRKILEIIKSNTLTALK